jgi:hypothetical protein
MEQEAITLMVGSLVLFSNFLPIVKLHMERLCYCVQKEEVVKIS